MSLELNLQKKLVGHWTMDSADVSGGTIYDRSSSDNNGSMSGGITTGASGQVGEAFDFDGSDDVVNLGDIYFNGWSEFTISAWVNPDTIVSNSGPNGHGPNEDYISHKAGSANDNFGLTYSSGGVAFYADDGSNSATIVGSSISTGVWTHIVAKFVANTEMKIYLDGVEDVASGDLPGTLDNTPNNVEIGARSSNGEYADGQIDDVRLYNRSLSGDEISALYNMRTQRNTYL